MEPVWCFVLPFALSLGIAVHCGALLVLVLALTNRGGVLSGQHTKPAARMCFSALCLVAVVVAAFLLTTDACLPERSGAA